MAALRCMLEKVGRTGFYNHGVRWTKLGVFGAVNVNNNYQHLLSRHSSFGRQCPNCLKLAQQVRASEGFDLPRGFNWGPPLHGVIQEYEGSLDDPAITKPALFAVEQHNKQQNTNLEFVRVVKINHQLLGGRLHYITLEAIDNGVKNTYQAKILRNATRKCVWELKLFRLAPDKPTNLIDKQGIGATGEDALAIYSTTTATSLLERQTSCSIINAMTVLRNLPDVKSCDDIFVFGSDFLLIDTNREMFLNGLQTDQERLAWLQWQLALDRASQSQIYCTVLLCDCCG